MFRLLAPAAATLLLASTLQNAPQNAAGLPAASLKTGTKLVVVDVTVTGKNHQPIHGLTAADFTLFENNTAQVLKNFEEHTAPTSAQLQAVPPMPKLPPGEFTNFSPASATISNGPANVLLIDRLNTAILDQNNIRNEVLNYLKKAKPGQHVAIFVLTQKLSMLQGFTDDPELLRATMEHYHAKGSPLLQNAVDGTVPKLETDSLPPGGELMEAQIDAMQQQDRTLLTLEAFNSLARYLSGIPGRKNVIWFSGAFPLSLLPDDDPALATAHASFNNIASFESDFHETVNLLTRAQIAVYPVDARGVRPSTCFSLARSRACTPNDHLKESNATWDEENTMRATADQTGGRAFMTNDLAGSIAEAVEGGSNYYTLTYTPTNGDWNGELRKIQVKLRLLGYELSYRRGYYADDPAHPQSSWAKLAEGRSVADAWLSEMQPTSGLYAAMVHGGPAPTQIVFTVQAAPTGPANEAALAANNAATPLMTGPYQRYELTFVANPRGLTFSDVPNGLRHAAVEFLTFVYTSNGDRLNVVENAVQLNLTAAQLAGALKNNMVFRQQVSVPVTGEYSLRTVMRDLGDDHVGAVEIPVSAVKNLAAMR